MYSLNFLTFLMIFWSLPRDYVHFLTSDDKNRMGDGMEGRNQAPMPTKNASTKNADDWLAFVYGTAIGPRRFTSK